MTPEQRETMAIFADCIDDELAGSETRGFTWAVVSVDRERYHALRAALAPPPTCGTCEHCDTTHAREGTGSCFGPNGSIQGWVPLHASCKFHAPTEPTR